ncbi:PKD domain-containing protein, partial [Candidatus Woesearchaeota archaeon]|nr:PKD domain-containing protein [Candidatus Woesearchaeota archaeon]
PASLDEGELLNVNFSASDADDDISSYLIYIDGIVVASGNSFSWNTNYTDAGSYNFTVYVNDSYGAEDSESEILTINDTALAPNITFVSTPSNVVEGNWLNVSFSAFALDPDSSIDSYQILVDGSLAASGNSYNWSTNSSDAGLYNFTFWVNDTKGMVDSEQRIINITDMNTAPNITEVNMPSSINEGDTINMNFTAVDAENNIDSYLISVNGTVVSTNSSVIGPTNYTDAGTYNITFYVNDSYGAEDSESEILTINDTALAPNITFVSTPSNVVEGNWLNVSFSAFALDPDSSIASYKIYRNGTIVANSSSYNWSTNSSDAGSYNFTFYVNDSKGMVDSEERVINVSEAADNNAPNITLTSPGASQSITVNSSIVFNIIAEDHEGSNLNVDWSKDGADVFNEIITNGTSSNYTYSFAQTGTFNISVLVTDNGSLTDSYNWTIIVTGTPIAITGNVILNEIMYDAVDETDGEWIEIYNNETFDINITGWILFESTNKTLSPNSTGIISSKDFAIITDNPTVFLSNHSGFTKPVFETSTGISLSNDGDMLKIYDSNDSLIDIVNYSSTWGGSNNHSIELNDTSLDNNNGSNWHTSSIAGGTPGENNSVIVLPGDFNVSWNQSVLALGIGNISDGNLAGIVSVDAIGNNTNVTVVQDSGDGNITHNFTTIDMDNGNSVLIEFVCLNSTAGYHEAVFNLTSDNDDISDQIIVNCTMNSTLLPEDGSNITDSWIKGEYWSGTHLNVTNVTGLVLSDVNISELANVTGGTFNIVNSTIFNSTILNGSSVTRCSISDSVFAGTCTDSIIDPTYIDGTSTVEDSTIIDSNITDNSIINQSDIYDSIVSNTNATGSDINNSDNVVNSTIIDSDITDTDVVGSVLNNSNVTNSELENVTMHDSEVIGTNLTDTVLEDANITDGVIYNGTILLSNSSVYNATSGGTMPLENITNIEPNAYFTYSKNYLAVSFTDVSTDPNINTPLNDSLRYNWSFGDSSYSTSADPSHSYSSAGSYEVVLTVFDNENESDSYTETITVSANNNNNNNDGGGGSSGRSSIGGSTAGLTYIVNLETHVFTRDIGVGDRVRFVFNSEKHYLTVNEVANSTVDFTLESDPINFSMKEGDIEKFDMDGDNVYDIYLKLDDILTNTSRADITLKFIEEDKAIEREEKKEDIKVEPVEKEEENFLPAGVEWSDYKEGENKTSVYDSYKNYITGGYTALREKIKDMPYVSYIIAGLIILVILIVIIDIASRLEDKKGVVSKARKKLKKKSKKKK